MDTWIINDQQLVVADNIIDAILACNADFNKRYPDQDYQVYTVKKLEYRQIIVSKNVCKKFLEDDSE